MKNFTLILFGLLVSAPIFAQTVSGKVRSASGKPIAGASITIQPSGSGTSTDDEGAYALRLSAGSFSISFSAVGFEAKTVKLTLASGDSKTLDVQLNDATSISENVVVLGTRSLPRTTVNTPLPTDVFQAKDIQSTGQASFDKALQYRVPSFNTVQTPVNDATSLLDPYEIRNMGSSRTLILINGKRKNMSALVYVQTSPGRGETGADLSSIPTEAIKRVDILRDGASAQYGSDAIAGVVNITLKDRYEYGTIAVNAGITHKGDGESFGVALNNGANFSENSYINYTVAFSQVGLANRPGKVDPEADASGNIGFGADIATVKSFLNRYPDGGNINGSPKTTMAKFAVNAGHGLGSNTQLYYNAAYVYKKVNSYANFRTPYWISRANAPGTELLGPNVGLTEGYVPTFEGNMSDYNATVGFKSKLSGWNQDASLTFGGNKMDFDVRNTINFSLGLNSPINFRPGGFQFNHLVGNLDLSRPISDNVSIALGMEFRSEEFTVFRGDTASYVGGGANSFPGFNMDKNLVSRRFNLGGYADLSANLSKDFLINATLRLEDYSDFGSAAVWKTSARYKFNDDKVVFRASASTGFRAPSLHQTSLRLSQASFAAGNIQVEGIVDNQSKEARALGVPKLTPEKSTSFTAGIALKPSSKLSLTLDYYNIRVNDRIVLGSKIRPTSNPSQLNTILERNGIKAISFFTNAIDTRTSGIDLVVSYRNINLGTGKLDANLSGNFTLSNELIGGLSAVKNTAPVAAAGQSVWNRTEEALILQSRPKNKVILGLDYTVGKFNINLNNTYFGKTTFHQGDMMQNDIDTEFDPKIVTDLGLAYDFTKKLNLAINLNNLLNVMPEWKLIARTDAAAAKLKDPDFVWTQTNLLTFNGRYSNLTYDGSHFSQLGLMLNAKLTYKF